MNLCLSKRFIEFLKFKFLKTELGEDISITYNQHSINTKNM